MVKTGMAALLALTAATSAQAATIFGVDELNNLVTIDSGNPAITTSSRAITGVTNSIQALDFRPLNNVLYGLGTDRVVYTINTATGVASAVSGVLNLTGTEFGFDFNPTIDRLRIVSNSNDNYVFNPNDGSLTTATPVFYTAGDANVGANPDVTALAYTSSTFGAAAASTQLYAIDTALDVLTRQANSAGTLNTVGSLGTNVGARTSFDIAGTDAFALNGRTLYNVNLTTGALSQVGLVDRSLFGIAIAAVPEPGTWALMLTGFGLTAFALRRRRAITTRVRFA
ncbi:DUF4394 domain-containing protein [Sphingomonas mollis]|uniref:DUF4394 domain-containing protein n=1 Tax=Sphingomonas mollis TaxID=2795726 RepID=A0ABS0XNF2_9SPHN|nr:DUF4394 domain-containing protein [Sphingomonas sp. BT553]MBJ6121532.1 DUF4394 domain-containing protein [Sphingomonas sp. BT553]